MVKLTSKRCPKSRNLVLDATSLDSLDGKKFDGILAIHLIQHLSKSMLKVFFQQVHDLLTDNGAFLLVFTNTCYPESGYQPEGSQDGVFTFWHKYGLEDIVPLLNKAKLKPISYRQQKSVDAACGAIEPFVFICKKS